jgi:FMN-dependent oxidoreductase (nitrilotriacetate monooxygenase family)
MSTTSGTWPTSNIATTASSPHIGTATCHEPEVLTPAPRQIRLNAFDMATPGHIAQGLWTHPRDNSTGYNKLSHWTKLAKTLEHGLFDGLFLADILGIYDVHGASPDAALRHAVQVPLLDPLLLVPAMAAVTTHLSFGVTANLAYEPPYLFARRMSTLDHLTDGRTGWNIVTGYLDSAARALGYSQQMRHDDRYDLADEYMDAVYALWEGSWGQGAVRRDKSSAIFADPSNIRRIDHHGRQFDISAYHLCEPSPQRTPVLYQAGSSPRGKIFAGRHAECVFVNGTNPAHLAPLVADLRAHAAPRRILVVAGATSVTGRTEREARDRLADYAAQAQGEAALVHASASLGIDLAAFGPDEPVDASASNAIRSNAAAMNALLGPGWTRRDLLAHAVLGSRQPPIVGSATQVADTLSDWMRIADLDGFNLSRTVMPEGLESVIELVIPLLQERGLYKTGYAPGTMRAKLLGQGDRLAPPHRAAAFRG